MNQYRSGQWRAYRAEVIKLDGGACVRCGASPESGAVLQVHHTRYLPGHKPWEYPTSLCETICRGCHAAEHGKIPPLVGWVLVGADDLEDLVGVCERCSNSIRYTYLIEHPRWHPLEVGTDCCDNLTCSTLASNHTESLVRQAARRKRFVDSHRWLDLGTQGHRIIQHTKAKHRVSVEVLSAGASGFRLVICGRYGRRVFESMIQAKAEAFDLLESGAIDDWLEGTPRRS